MGSGVECFEGLILMKILFIFEGLGLPKRIKKLDRKRVIVIKRALGESGCLIFH